MVFGRMIHPISSLSQLNASNQIVWGVLSAGRDGEIPATKAPGMFSFFSFSIEIRRFANVKFVV
jgi:hypothetical protein